MQNQEIANILYEIGEFLEADNIAFKPQAYKRAAQSILTLNEEISEIYKKYGFKGLEDIQGVGENIALKIEELLKTGKLKYLEKLKNKLPVDMLALTEIEGVGPKSVKKIYEHLKIETVDQLEKAAKEGGLKNIEGFGEKKEEEILKGIEFLKKSNGRGLLADILPLALDLADKLRKLKEVKKIELAGSLRRKEETIGDIDLVAASANPEKVMSYFCSLPEIDHIYSSGPTKTLVRLKSGIDADLRVVPEKNFGAALLYFTGNKEESIALREVAHQKGMKLNEYGLFKGSKLLASKTEKDIYNALGFDYIEPEMRLNNGELDLVRATKLPKLIELNDIKGDLHVHTVSSDGINSIEEIAYAAKKLNYKYIAITDHTKYLSLVNGLDEKRLIAQIKKIKTINKKIKGIEILSGAEVNILKNGDLDIKNEVLKMLEVVIVGVHSNFKMEEEDMTKRICKALANPYVNILSHPTGRLIKEREGYHVNLAEIFKVAKKNGVAMEINSFPNRLDLNNNNIKTAIQNKVKLSIDTDSHSVNQLEFMQNGVWEARRGGAEAKDVINALPLKKLKKFLKK